jgi:hypothetical protein
MLEKRQYNKYNIIIKVPESEEYHNSIVPVHEISTPEKYLYQNGTGTKKLPFPEKYHYKKSTITSKVLGQAKHLDKQSTST